MPHCLARAEAWFGVTDRTSVQQLFANQRSAEWRQMLRGVDVALPDCLLSWREVGPEQYDEYGGFGPIVQVAELVMR